jgi:hypothetical protein
VMPMPLALLFILTPVAAAAAVASLFFLTR